MTMRRWSWAAASRRGTAHERCGQARQDAFRVLTAGGGDRFIVTAVCDGAGSAPRGGVGAALAAGALARCAQAWLAAFDRMPGTDAAASWMLLAGQHLAAVAAARGLEPRALATTALLAVSDGAETLTAHVGDGTVVARSASGGWTALSWPSSGEYASTTEFLTDPGPPALRVAVHQAAVDRLVLLTDGLERLALDFRAGTAHAAFVEPVARPVAERGRGGHDRELSALLAGFLDGPRVNEATDDDKTLVVAALA